MKVEVVGTGEHYKLSLTAENKADNTSILELALALNSGNQRATRTVAPKYEQDTETSRKKYKRQITKACPACGRKVKGNLGLGVHLSSHPTCKEEVERQKQSEYDSYPYHCDKCGKGFQKEKSMNIHYGHVHLKGGKTQNQSHAEVKTNFLGDIGSLKQRSVESSAQVIR